MSNKSRNVLWMVAGMYLTYTGYGLFRNLLGTDTDKKVMFMIFAAVFVGGGIFLIVYALRNLYKNINSEDTVEVDPDEAEEGAKEAEEALEKLEEQDAAEAAEEESAKAVDNDEKE